MNCDEKLRKISLHVVRDFSILWLTAVILCHGCGTDSDPQPTLSDTSTVPGKVEEPEDSPKAQTMNERPQVPMTLTGWNQVDSNERTTTWQDQDLDSLSLTPGVGPLDRNDLTRLREQCRGIVIRRGAGLVEANVIPTRRSSAAAMIMKRLDGTGFVFTTIIQFSDPDPPSLWVVATRERGVTGTREAVVTQRKITNGELTLQSYQDTWAQDPYDPTFRGEDSRNLRYMSDDESFDSEFPNHPLSKARRMIRELVEMMNREGEKKTQSGAP